MLPPRNFGISGQQLTGALIGGRACVVLLPWKVQPTSPPTPFSPSLGPSPHLGLLLITRGTNPLGRKAICSRPAHHRSAAVCPCLVSSGGDRDGGHPYPLESLAALVRTLQWITFFMAHSAESIFICCCILLLSVPCGSAQLDPAQPT